MDGNQVNNNMNQTNNGLNQMNNINNNKIDNNEQNKRDRKGRVSFYGIIAVAVFIIIAIGATFAFFTATARSGDSTVGTRSSTLALEFISYNTAWSNQDIIPAETEVAEYSVEYQDDTTFGNNTAGDNDTALTSNKNNTLCKDDYGNSVCSVYEFQVRNPANSPQSITLNLITNTNEFENLHAMAYELSIKDDEEYNNVTEKDTEGKNGYGDPIFKTSAEDDTENAIAVLAGTDRLNEELYDENPIYINRKGVQKELLKYEESENVIKPSIALPVKKADDAEQTLLLANSKNGEKLTIDGGTTRTFIVVLYVLNKNEDQTLSDANKEFRGSIEVSNGDGSTGVSGSISASGGADLQGNQSNP